MATTRTTLSIGEQFPALAQSIGGHRLAYLDNASTTQMPQTVLDAIASAHIKTRANVHRGVHTLSGRATDAYESARVAVARFINAESADDVIFCSGATAALNMVAHAWGDRNVGPGDEILVTAMEHHSNFVPWQALCNRVGATLRVAPMDEHGSLDCAAFEGLLRSSTKVVALTHVSNALGTVNAVRKLTALAHRVGAVVVVDGAQAAPHLPIDVAALGCDFYAFSGHKMYGPTGIGILYGAPDILHAMAPHHTGGGMVTRVTAASTNFAGAPHRFEPGTPNVVGAIGLGAAIGFVESLGLENIAAHESALLAYAGERLESIEEVRRIGTAEKTTAVCSFVVRDIHPHDVATILDGHGVAVQAGHHCAQPAMDHFGVTATVRLSLAAYNTRQDIDVLARSIRTAVEVISR